jgi:hypothetical protein
MMPRAIFGSASHFADRNLQGAADYDLFSVELVDDIDGLHAAAAGGRVSRDLGDDGARGILEIEEAGVVRRHVVHADAEVAVLHLAVFDQLRGYCAHNLRLKVED